MKAYKVLTIDGSGGMNSFAMGLPASCKKKYRTGISNVARKGSKLFVFKTYDVLKFCKKQIGAGNIQVWQVDTDVLEPAPETIPYPSAMRDMKYLEKFWKNGIRSASYEAFTQTTPVGTRLCNRLKLVKRMKDWT